MYNNEVGLYIVDSLLILVLTIGCFYSCIKKCNNLNYLNDENEKIKYNLNYKSIEEV